MGKGLHFPFVRVQRCLHDVFAVARGEAARNPGGFGHGFIEPRELFDDDLQRRALVAAVIGV